MGRAYHKAQGMGPGRQERHPVGRNADSGIQAHMEDTLVEIDHAEGSLGALAKVAADFEGLQDAIVVAEPVGSSSQLAMSS